MKQLSQPVLHLLHEREYFPLCYKMLLGGLIMFSAGVQAVSSVNGRGEGGDHGVLQVTGMLTQGTCRLDMQSVNQSVDLGNTEMASLKRVGDRGTPVAVQLFLRDCQVRDGWQTNSSTVVPRQSVVTVSFSGLQNTDNPALLKVLGASGFGLHLMDRQMRDVHLGRAGNTQPLNPGNNELTYYVVPERTRAPLVEGAYRAVFDFRLSYD
ncbi:fimbrial protein [Enterobacter bugandensis]|uniref:fimbrial protein n=1 Tax=Enterobacter bugandensis TaxID=881260 RepID=UPI0020052F09|nr:fimbrial protein [Enterobacter bugandensis]MCK6964555.1 type 1 fimbrial protein [Enterobacter bugandensis]